MTATTDETAILDRLDRVESRNEIDELLADYAFCCDRHDADRFMGIWTDDAEYHVGGAFGDASGKEEIRKVLDGIWESSPETHHWITDRIVRFADADAATGEAHTICHVKNAEGQELFVSCDYDNRYVRQDGRWLISACRLDVHWWKTVDLVAIG
jgi:uncharacterized protein (TIGR02246 family)